jgi:hypothetical protein
MPMDTLLDPNGVEEYLKALVALSFAAATTGARLRSRVHVDRDTLRRAMGRLMVGMRVYR